ncbi:hypothetical+protein [Methylocapsa aurea]
MLWKPLENFSVKLGLDFLDDYMSPYYGTPLVPISYARSPMTGVISSSTGLALDQVMRFNNYNVGDALLSTTQFMPTAHVVYKPTSEITFTDDV